MASEKFFHEGREAGAESFHVGVLLVHVGGDVEGAATVHTFDRGETFDDFGLGDAAKGHFETAGDAHAHGFECGETFAVITRHAQHDFDFIAATLDALDFITVKRLAHLPGEVVDGDAELTRFWFEAKLNLAATGVERVVDIEDVRKL